MNRRTFLYVLTFGTLTASLAAESQTGRTYRLAYVNSASETEERKPHLQALRTGLRELGYVEGGNLIVDVRFAEADVGRLPALVDEVLVPKPDVLLGFEDVAQVMRTRTTSTPIVLTGALDPIKAGLAQSLARPGMNVTGSTQLMDELTEKHFEILRQILPRLARVGQLVDTTAPGCRLIESYARQSADRLGIVFMPYPVANRAEIERAFARMERERPQALLPCPSPILFSLRHVLFENAARLRIPFTSYVVVNVPAGVLFAYAATIEEGYYRAASYVDKILKGAKPGDLPIEQPSKFKLVINRRTAKALGLTIPQSVLLRADQVIE